MAASGRGGPIVFDAYGTLFDPASLAVPLERRFPGRGAALAATWRATQLRHTWLRSLMGTWADFDAITRDALVQTLADARVTPAGTSDPADPSDPAGASLAPLLADLLAAYRTLPPYADVRDGLAALPPDRPRAILTNGTHATVSATVAAAGLASALPVVLSVEGARTYKPSPAVYALAADHFGVPPADVTFVSGNAWDCAGAAAFGLHVVRVRRSPEAAERVGPAPAATIATLADLGAVLAP